MEKIIIDSLLITIILSLLLTIIIYPIYLTLSIKYREKDLNYNNKSYNVKKDSNEIIETQIKKNKNFH